MKLKDGFGLEIVSVDVTSEKVTVQLLKDNGRVGDPIIIGPFREDSTMEDETYLYKADFGPVENHRECGRVISVSTFCLA